MSGPHSVAENIVNEVEYLKRLERTGVPEPLREGLVRYFVHHIRPGHFLTAVLKNDLREAFARGDEPSLAGLRHLVIFLDNEVPIIAWGSSSLVEAWIAERVRS